MRADTVRVDTVRVEGPRPHGARAAFAAPTFSAVLRAARPAEALTDLPERLAQAAGVTIRSYGGPGALAAVSIRGSSSAQVEVFFDGIPLARARDGFARLGDLPLAGLDRIEVTRGFAPAALATAPLGGAINLVPLELPARTATLHVAGGAFRTAEASLAVGLGDARGAWRASGYASAFSSAGDFSFLDDNGTPYASADDEVVERRNDAVETAGGGLVVTHALGTRSAVTLLADVGTRRQGLPGTGAVQATSASFASNRALAGLRVRSAVLGSGSDRPALHVEALAWGLGVRERFTDRKGELGAGNQDNDDRTLSTGLRASARARAGPDEIEAVAEVIHERLRTRDLWPTTVELPLVTRTTRRVALEHRWSPLGGRVVVAPSYRIEDTESRAGELVRIGGSLPVPPTGLEPHARTETPAIGLRIAPHRALALKGHVGRYRRLPSFLELFGERGTLTGNPRLAPESGTHADAGVALATEALVFELAAFHVDARDLVVFVQNSQRTAVAQNVGRARIQGLEATLTLVRGRHVRLDATATLETARDVSDNIYTSGRILPGRPLRDAFASLLVRAGAVDVRAEVAAASGTFLDRANRSPLPRRALGSAGAALHAGPGLTLSVTLKNVTDAHVYDVAGYPLPGRALYVALDHAVSRVAATPSKSLEDR